MKKCFLISILIFVGFLFLLSCTPPRAEKSQKPRRTDIDTLKKYSVKLPEEKFYYKGDTTCPITPVGFEEFGQTIEELKDPQINYIIDSAAKANPAYEAVYKEKKTIIYNYIIFGLIDEKAKNYILKEYFNKYPFDLLIISQYSNNPPDGYYWLKLYVSDLAKPEFFITKKPPN